MLSMNTYKLVVFGANGRTGLQLVQQALDMGHTVTAIARNPSTLALRHKNLIVHKGDVLDLSSFQNSLANQDYVLSALGVASNKPTVVYSEGIRNIIEAMKIHQISRLIVVSSLAVEINPTMPSWMRFFIRYILQPLLSHIYADTLKMEEILMRSDVCWTIVRPPQLTNKSVTGRYRVAIDKHLPRALKISRSDLAHFLLHHLSSENTFRRKIEVAS